MKAPFAWRHVGWDTRDPQKPAVPIFARRCVECFALCYDNEPDHVCPTPEPEIGADGRVYRRAFF